jgi:glycerate dehydrogenase
VREVLLNHGVFLDLGSVDNEDLDLKPLAGALDNWRWFTRTTKAQLRDRIIDAEVVISNKVALDADILRETHRLKLIIVAATGTNNVDLDAATELGITVCNCRDYATQAVTQHTLTAILNLLTGQVFYRDRVRSGDWCRAPHFSLFDRPIRQVADLNLGIVGYGILGRSVAEGARRLGMNVLVAERRGEPPRGERHTFENVVRHADVISIHCPLTSDTANLFDRATMKRMKPTAFLVNTARGGIVNEADLAQCLREDVIAGAAVDVLSQEPPPVDHPLLAEDLPTLLLTPHNAWATPQARQALIDQILRLIHAFERDQVFNRVA